MSEPTPAASPVPPASPYVAPVPGQRTNVLSIISLVLAILGISIGGVILGHISLNQIKKTHEAGHGLALAGLIIGYIGCAGWIIFWIIYIVAIAIYGTALFGATSSYGFYN